MRNNMIYDKTLANLIGCAKSYEEQQQLEYLFQMVEIMIQEQVPQIIGKYMSEHREMLTYDIRTFLNDELINLPEVKKEIISQIINQLNK